MENYVFHSEGAQDDQSPDSDGERTDPGLDVVPEHQPDDGREPKTKDEAQEDEPTEAAVEKQVNQEAALATLRCLYDTLIQAIQEPLSQLATPLYSEGVLSSQDVERARLPSMIVSERNAQLLDAIEHQVKTNPQHFVTFLDIATKDSILNSQAIELKQTYERFCVDPQSMEPFTKPSSPEVQAYARYLKEHYSRSAIDPGFKWPPPLPLQRFVNLALVKKEVFNQNDLDDFAKSTLHGNVDQILGKKEPIVMEEVLDPPEGQQSVKCVLLDGAPGVGKSTFAWELCRKWDDIRALKKYSLVLLLRFREKRIQLATKIEDLFYHDDTELQQAVAKEVVKYNGCGLLLILDGFDELPVSLRTNSLLARIMRGQSLSKCTLLITSRPSAMQSLTAVLKHELIVTKHVEALGFTQENIEDYARHVFSDSKELDEFLAYISINQNPAIRSLMYIPLNSSIVTNLYKENKKNGKPVLQTITQLYTELCLVLIRRYLASKDDPCIDHLPSKLKDLPHHLYDLLLGLSRVAFKGILDKVIVFEELTGSIATMGFTTAVPELYRGSRAVRSYSFLHLTLQEFLAAFYLSQLTAESKECQEILVKSARTITPLISPVVHIFLAGLVGNDLSHFGWKVAEVIGKVPITRAFIGGSGSSITINALYECKVRPPCTCAKHVFYRGVWDFSPDTANPDSDFCVYPFLTRCIFEAPESNVYDHMLSHNGTLMVTVPGMTPPFDYYALGHCIASYKCSWSLSLTNGCRYNDIQMLINGLKSTESVYGKIESLNLEGVPLCQEGLDNLDSFPKVILSGLKSLDISRCYERPFTTLNTKRFATVVIPLMSSLQALNISFNYFEENGIANILKAITGHSTLRTLVIVNRNIEQSDLDELSAMLKKTHLTELRIGGSRWEPMKPETTDVLMKVIFQPSTLKTVNIIYADFNDALDCPPLTENKNVTTFALTHCLSINSAIVQLCKTLEKNQIVRVLLVIQDELAIAYPPNKIKADVRIRDTRLDSFSIKALSEMIKNNDTLERLELRNIKCSLQDALRLFLSLALENTSLRSFVLPIIYGPASSVGLYHTWAYTGAFSVDPRAKIEFDVNEIREHLNKIHTQGFITK